MSDITNLSESTEESPITHNIEINNVLPLSPNGYLTYEIDFRQLLRDRPELHSVALSDIKLEIRCVSLLGFPNGRIVVQYLQ